MQKEILKNFNREVKSFYCAFLSLSDVTSFILMMMMIRTCAILHIRIANRLVMGSCCRGGIVRIRGGCSRARSVRPKSSKALWRFRASTSNSPSGRSWPHTHTHIAILIMLTLNKIFEYVEMTISSRPSGSSPNPKALWLLRVSI